MIYACTFVLAFCSIVYELLLGQTLSAFLGNTVLRYSVTIGLYMLSMGAGAFLVRERMLRRPVLALQRVEILLTMIGAGSVSVLFMLDAAGVNRFLFTASAHLLIVVIGVLTGLELPLLIELRRLEKRDTEGAVLGVDYVGAFVGTVAFAFLFYPRIGIVPTSFAVAALNAAVGVILFTQGAKVKGDGGGRHRGMLAAQGVLLGALLVCLHFSAAINEYEVGLYLGE